LIEGRKCGSIQRDGKTMEKIEMCRQDLGSNPGRVYKCNWSSWVTFKDKPAAPVARNSSSVKTLNGNPESVNSYAIVF
jgi:hypothetical protein